MLALRELQYTRRNVILAGVVAIYAGAFLYLDVAFFQAISIEAVVRIATILVTIEGVLLGVGGRFKSGSSLAPAIALTSILYSLFVITLGEIVQAPQLTSITSLGVSALLSMTILLFSATAIAYALNITDTRQQVDS